MVKELVEKVGIPYIKENRFVKVVNA